MKCTWIFFLLGIAAATAVKDEEQKIEQGHSGEYLHNVGNFTNVRQYLVRRRAASSIYCFPDSPVTYRNVWGGYDVQVKDSGSSACDPGGNKFQPAAVSLSNGNELKLQFRHLNGAWMGSEVRVLRSNGTRFQYGTYQFRVKSISVRDSISNRQISNALPISLVLGLFTWDPVKPFGTNYNHEIDIEISQWNNQSLADAQFVVQPARTFQTFRDWTGGSLNQRQQSGHTWKFTWNPGVIVWTTSAGGGITRRYSTAKELAAGRADFVQCMSPNVEIRMNLWNMFGMNTPTGMTTNQMVEVVIDDFSFTPSGLTGIPNGRPCSKACQCLKGSTCSSAKKCRVKT
jgi:hypothetical protein